MNARQYGACKGSRLKCEGVCFLARRPGKHVEAVEHGALPTQQ